MRLMLNLRGLRVRVDIGASVMARCCARLLLLVLGEIPEVTATD